MTDSLLSDGDLRRLQTVLDATQPRAHRARRLQLPDLVALVGRAAAHGWATAVGDGPRQTQGNYATRADALRSGTLVHIVITRNVGGTSSLRLSTIGARFGEAAIARRVAEAWEVLERLGGAPTKPGKRLAFGYGAWVLTVDARATLEAIVANPRASEVARDAAVGALATG